MSLVTIRRWTVPVLLLCAPLNTTVGQDKLEPSLPAPATARSTADSDTKIQAGSTADTGIGEVGQRLDGATPPRRASPLLRIQNRVENRIRNRIDRNYDPTVNATAPFQRAEGRTAPF